MSRQFPLSLRLHGARFADAKLPSAAFQELYRIEELLFLFGAAVWKTSNPGRSRLPKGFRERFSLAVSAIETGSTVPVLVYADSDSSQAELRLDAGSEDAAAELLIRAMTAVNQDVEDEPMLRVEPKVLKLLAGLGSSLLADETMTLEDSASRRVEWSVSSRAKVGNRNHNASVVVQRRLVGRVSGVLERPPEVQIVLRDGQVVRLPMPEPPNENWSSAYGERWRTLASVEARVAVRPSGGIERCLETVAAELENGVEDGDLAAMERRIAELKALADGWFDGAGKGASEAQWKATMPLAVAIASFLHEGRPAIFLAPDGNPRLEILWRDRWDVSIDVESDGTVYGHALCRVTGSEEEFGWHPQSGIECDDALVQWLDSLSGTSK